MNADQESIFLTLRLAAITTIILLLLAAPLAYYLATVRSRLALAVETICYLPLVLPPTVLGFYLLQGLGAQSFLGKAYHLISNQSLVFSFHGLVVASIVYSLPFALTPLTNAFRSIGSAPLNVAASLGAGPVARFFKVMLPLSKGGLISSAALSFAHTLGEFGVVLMMGGSIPGETKVVSIAIYEHVESMNYSAAHKLSFLLLALSSSVLLIFIYLGKSNPRSA